jgi:hypothetical protein
MEMQFPNGQIRYVAGDGFTTRAFLPVGGGVLQAHGKFPGEKRISFSFKVRRWLRTEMLQFMSNIKTALFLYLQYGISCLQNRSGGSVVPMVQWPDKSLSLGLVQPLSWRRSGLMLQPATQIRQIA